MLSIDVLTLFPQFFAWMRESRPVRNAIEAGELSLREFDLREFTPLRAGQVDDMPYGGGAGMVLRVDVVVAALEAIYRQQVEEIRSQRRVIVLTPAGRTFDDAYANELRAEERDVTLLCGRYEGFDHRVHEHVANEELSLGDFVLSGGEPAAMCVIDAVARKLRGALGNDESLEHESFGDALEGGVEYPHYTRPESFRDWTVPSVLLGGHHANIDEWRREQSRERSGRRAGG